MPSSSALTTALCGVAIASSAAYYAAHDIKSKRCTHCDNPDTPANALSPPHIPHVEVQAAAAPTAEPATPTPAAAAAPPAAAAAPVTTAKVAPHTTPAAAPQPCAGEHEQQPSLSTISDADMLHWAQDLLVGLASRNTACPASAVLNREWQRGCLGLLPRTALEAFRPCPAGPQGSLQHGQSSIAGHAYSHPGCPSAVATATHSSSSSSSSSLHATSLHAGGGQRQQQADEQQSPAHQHHRQLARVKEDRPGTPQQQQSGQQAAAKDWDTQQPHTPDLAQQGHSRRQTGEHSSPRTISSSRYSSSGSSNSSSSSPAALPLGIAYTQAWQQHCSASITPEPDVTTSASSKDACLERHASDSSSSSSSSSRAAEQAPLQELQHHQQLPAATFDAQQLAGLACSLSQAEQLVEQLQQYCSSLSADNVRLRSCELSARARARQLEVKHDACFTKLMQAQQQLEQQRVQQSASRGITGQRLRSMLQQLRQAQRKSPRQQQDCDATQAHSSGAAAAAVVSEEQQRQEQQTKQGQKEETQQQQQQGQQEGKAGSTDSGAAAVADEAGAQPGELGDELLWQLVAQLEAGVQQLIDSKHHDLAPVQHLQQQVQQLTADLQQAGRDKDAAAAEKQNLQKCRDTLQRKLSDAQQQLLAKTADLSAITNDRNAIAAAKTKLAHSCTTLQAQQQVLELAVQQAKKEAAGSATRAVNLHKALAASEANLAAAQTEQQQKAEQLKVVQSERDNGLHQVAQLQLKLQAVQLEHSNELQRVAQLQQQLKVVQSEYDSCVQKLTQLQQQLLKSSASSNLLQEQLKAAHAAREESLQQVAQLQQQVNAAASEAQQVQQQQQQAAKEQAEKLQKVQQQLSALQSEHDSSAHQMAKLQQQARSAAEGVKLLQQQLSAVQAERDAGLEQIAKLKQECALLELQHEAAEACAIELHLKLQACQQQLKTLQDASELESSQLVEALGAAQARIAGPTQQVAEAQLDVTQLAQVVELQQQQLAWQQEQNAKLRTAISRSNLQVVLPDDVALYSSTGTSPAVSPSPLSPSRAPLHLASPNRPQQELLPGFAITTPRPAASAAAGAGTGGAVAMLQYGVGKGAARQGELPAVQLPGFLLSQATDDAPGSPNPLYAPLGNDSLPAEGQHNASCSSGVQHAPALPMPEGGEENSSSSSPSSQREQLSISMEYHTQALRAGPQGKKSKNHGGSSKSGRSSSGEGAALVRQKRQGSRQQLRAAASNKDKRNHVPAAASGNRLLQHPVVLLTGSRSNSGDASEEDEQGEPRGWLWSGASQASSTASSQHGRTTGGVDRVKPFAAAGVGSLGVRKDCKTPLVARPGGSITAVRQ